MYLMKNISMLMTLVITILMMMTMYLSKKSFQDREKNSPFECGFDPKSSARMPFSLQFFLITIMFLIFDVEITLILPTIPMMLKSSIITIMTTTILLLIILLMGLLHEWNQGALEWAK